MRYLLLGLLVLASCSLRGQTKTYSVPINDELNAEIIFEFPADSAAMESYDTWKIRIRLEMPEDSIFKNGKHYAYSGKFLLYNPALLKREEAGAPSYAYYRQANRMFSKDGLIEVSVECMKGHIRSGDIGWVKYDYIYWLDHNKKLHRIFPKEEKRFFEFHRSYH